MTLPATVAVAISDDITFTDIVAFVHRHASGYEQRINQTLEKFNNAVAQADGDNTRIWLDSSIVDGVAELAGTGANVRRTRELLKGLIEREATKEELVVAFFKEGNKHVRNVARTSRSTSQAVILTENHAAYYWARLLEDLEYFL